MRTNLIILILLVCAEAIGQTISNDVPRPINKSGKFLFYLHGGVVTNLGNNAVNPSRPEWGPYQYLAILDSLQKRGFNVISENRKASINDSVYIERVAAQIDTLLRSGVTPSNIVVVGASAGSHIALYASHYAKNSKMKFVIMGGCWPKTYEDYIDIELFGNFLSIFEATDPHQSCLSIFEGRKTLTTYDEVKLNTGLSHGFIYKGYDAWIDPLCDWFDKH